MSTQQDPKKVTSDLQEETKPADQLANEELDQVVGGSGPSSVAAPKLPTISSQSHLSEKPLTGNPGLIVQEDDWEAPR